ncbi:19991_t:CDS:2, partial [Racocetra fulgida]
NSDILLDETIQDYKWHDNLSQADIISEGLTQESTNSLFEESSQASCSYTLIEDSNHESLMSIDNQSHSSYSSFDNHKQLQDKALQQVKKNRQLIPDWEFDSHVYAKVQKPGDIYEVKIKTNAANVWNPIIAQIYIDGYTDNSQHVMLSSESKTQNTFSSATGDTKYYFKFRNFTLSEFDQLEKQKSKGLGYPGAVSAAFYLARFVDNDMPTIPDFMLTSQDDTIDSKKLSSIPASFDKSEEKLLPPLNYEKFKNEPIAVLHLNYRPAPWFSDELEKNTKIDTFNIK